MNKADIAGQDLMAALLVVGTIADVRSEGKKTTTSCGAVKLASHATYQDGDATDLDDAFGGLAEKRRVARHATKRVDRCAARVIAEPFQHHMLWAKQCSAIRLIFAYGVQCTKVDCSAALPWKRRRPARRTVYTRAGRGTLPQRLASRGHGGALMHGFWIVLGFYLALQLPIAMIVGGFCAQNRSASYGAGKSQSASNQER